jgi:hypothetical protein
MPDYQVNSIVEFEEPCAARVDARGQPPDHVTEMMGWLPRGFSVPRLCVEQDADQQARLGPSIAPAVVHALDDHCVERFQQDLIFVQDAVDLPAENDAQVEGVGTVHRRVPLLVSFGDLLASFFFHVIRRG